MLIVGTNIKFKIIQYLRTRRRCNVGIIIVDVDEMILFEHLINLLNIPIILLQLLRILFPISITRVLGNMASCFIIEVIGSFVIFHRSIGGLGIAAVR